MHSDRIGAAFQLCVYAVAACHHLILSRYRSTTPLEKLVAAAQRLLKSNSTPSAVVLAWQRGEGAQVVSLQQQKAYLKSLSQQAARRRFASSKPAPQPLRKQQAGAT